MIGYNDGGRDMDRIGLFWELSYLHGKAYTPPIKHTEVRDLKGAQMNPGAPKWKCGNQDGYFDDTYRRAFEKEGWMTTFQRDLKQRLKNKEKNITPIAFSPSSYPKKNACPGDYNGTFGGIIKAFSPLPKPKADKQDEKLSPYPLIGAPKKGGPGYVDITIGPYPKYKASLYDDPFVSASDPKRQVERQNPFLSISTSGYFQKNPYVGKVQASYHNKFEKRTTAFGPFMPPSRARKRGDIYHGGMGKYPEFMSNYPPRKPKGDQPKALGGPFYPPIRDRTGLTKSIMKKKIDDSMNSKNWRSMQPVTFTREII